MKHRAIREHDRRYSIRLMCRALAVSPAGYYAWSARPESARAAANRVLLADIRVIHRESRETYGSPSIWDALIKQGHGVGKHRIARLMRVEGIRAKTVKKWRATTQANHRLPIAENTLNRQFTVAHPNRVWAGDITYVWTPEGWLYLAVVLDLYSRTVIGWAMGPRLTVDLAEHALTMALTNRQPICRHDLPAGADLPRYDPQHVETGQLLGQCLCRKLLRDSQARAHLSSPVPHASRSNPGYLRVH